MSADFTSENFSAAWYLIENHSNTRLVGAGLCCVVSRGAAHQTSGNAGFPLALLLSSPLISGELVNISEYLFPYL